MPWSLLFSVGKFVVPLLLLGGAYLWITTAAYNRGVAATEQKMIRYIAIQKKAVTDDVQGHQTMTDDELDAALKKKCLEAGGSKEQCA